LIIGQARWCNGLRAKEPGGAGPQPQRSGRPRQATAAAPILASTRSLERLEVAVPAMRRALGRVLRAQRFDVVKLEFSWSAEPSN
jgi:hypothetical protein